MLLLVDNLETGVGHKGLGDTDAFGRLVVLQECCNDARQGEGRAVQGVAELGLLGLGIAETALQTVGLIGIEVAD